MRWKLADFFDDPEYGFYIVFYAFKVYLSPWRTINETRFLRSQFPYCCTGAFQFFYLGFVCHILLSHFRFQSPAARLFPSVIFVMRRNP